MHPVQGLLRATGHLQPRVLTCFWALVRAKGSQLSNCLIANGSSLCSLLLSAAALLWSEYVSSEVWLYLRPFNTATRF